jgi:hypothetical protein
MPREAGPEDEARYAAEKPTTWEKAKAKAKKLVSKPKDEKAIEMKKKKEMIKMDNPDADPELPMKENISVMTKELLENRRALEYELVARSDKREIDARLECWYLMDTQWLAQWTNFIDGSTDCLPPRITSKHLYDKDGKLLENLEAKIDYRGVPPNVFHVLKELYGHDDSPQLCRYRLDIYEVPVPDSDKVIIQYKPMMESRIRVNTIRSHWTDWKEHEIVDDEPDCCCGLTKEHIEAIIYWCVRCFSRRGAGRKNISYRNYRPVKGLAPGEIEGERDGLLDGDGVDEEEADRELLSSDPERDYARAGEGVYGASILKAIFGWGM